MTRTRLSRTKVKGTLAGGGVYCGDLPHSLLLTACVYILYFVLQLWLVNEDSSMNNLRNVNVDFSINLGTKFLCVNIHISIDISVHNNDE